MDNFNNLANWRNFGRYMLIKHTFVECIIEYNCVLSHSQNRMNYSIRTRVNRKIKKETKDYSNNIKS